MTDTAGEIEAIVQGQLEAFKAQDVERFLAYFADDFVAFEFPNTVRLEGKSAARDAYRTLFSENPDLRAHVSTRIVRPPCVIDHEHVIGHRRRPDGTNGFVVYEVRNGLIQRFWSGAWSDRQD